MARSDTETLLGLDAYARMIGADPRHFNQLTCRAFPVKKGTSSLWYQTSWPNAGRACRDEVAQAIAEAEELIADTIGYFVAPKYIAQEAYTYPLPPSGRTSAATPALLNLRKLRFVAAGYRFVATVQDSVDISTSYVDPDGDGWNESVSISITHADASQWDASEIGVFPHDSPTDEIYRIRDLRVAISGTTITIRGQSAQFIVPDLWDNDEVIDGDDSSVFLDSVDIKRIYTDSSEAYPGAVMEWSSLCTTPPTSPTYGVLLPYLPEQGIVTLYSATWDDATQAWTYGTTLPCACSGLPNRILLSYLSGQPLQRGQINPKLARAVAALATARLTTPVSGGGESIDKLHHEWQVGIAKPTYQQSGCPFGMRQGAWIAWQTVHALLGSLDSVTV